MRTIQNSASVSSALVVTLALCELSAQGLEARPNVHELRIAPGARIDLETGVVLPSDKVHSFVADVVFERDGKGFYAVGRHGAQKVAPGVNSPEEGEWGKGRFHSSRHDAAPIELFVKTDRGLVAKVSIAIVDSYSTGSAVIRWVVRPGKEPVFIDGPKDLRLQRLPKNPKAVEFSWTGESGRYRVEVRCGAKVHTQKVREPRVRIEELEPGKLHTIHVRELLANGMVSLPTSMTFLCAPRPARRGVVTFPDRWYDQVGGIELGKGAESNDAADVVFYLYGIYASGGGVQKIGRGLRDYHSVAEIPLRGYLPVHGRLDEFDVHAIRLGDGRFAKLMLEPTDGKDLRSGMRVHFTYLEGGGRYLLPRPTAGKFRAERGGLTVRWNAAPSATEYHVERIGDPGGAKVTKARELRFTKLPPNRFYRFRVIAIDGGGDRSDPLLIEAHTFGAGYRVGRVTLNVNGRQGYVFAKDDFVPASQGEPDLYITNSAGGATALSFAGKHGLVGSGGVDFGDFNPPAEGYRNGVQTDRRRPKSEVFWVKTAAGGVAQVRIRSRKYPNVELDYVYRLGKK